MQPDLDAAHADDQDPAGRSGRQLRLGPAGSCQRLHPSFSVADCAAADCVAGHQRASCPWREPMSGTTIRLKGCRKAFADGTVAVQDLHLTIEPGETLAILGPSGCGKTTTLRLIAGLERLDVGQVLFDDQDVTRLPIERRDVGMVFQNYALFPNLDVAGNIVYGLKIRGLSAAERNKRCDELLELVGLTGHGNRRVNELSGGQRQRVALALPSRRVLGCCCLTNRLPRWTRSCVSACVASLISCCAGWVLRRSSSPTIRAKRWRWATGFWLWKKAVCRSWRHRGKSINNPPTHLSPGLSAI
ncbi:ABC transporter [Pseudomonas coronafaciens pv. porri]|nr:ABC transporter [Pseudomonas coronafaciens pv. porri]